MVMIDIIGPASMIWPHWCAVGRKASQSKVPAEDSDDNDGDNHDGNDDFLSCLAPHLVSFSLSVIVTQIIGLTRSITIW